MSGSLTISIQRRAAAVQVEIGARGGVGKAVVQALAGVLFHVQARDADAFRASISRGNVDPSVLGERLVVLRNLVALGQVGIEVVFARKDRALTHRAVQRQRRQGRELDGLCIQDRQSPRQPQAYRADVRVGLGAKPVGATAKCLASQ